MISRNRWWIAILACMVIIQAAAVLDYADDQRYLSELLEDIASASLPPSEQVKRVVNFLQWIPAEVNNSYCLLPVFRFLRPTARQVAQQGGDCADRSRLVIRLLNLRNIKASKWALYSDVTHPQHAVVQIETEVGSMVVDAQFGLWFPRPHGGYYAVADLKASPEILLNRIQELRARREQPGIERLELYRFDRYVYTNPRTINWDASPTRQTTYRILSAVFGPQIHDLPRPAMVEEPALMIVLAMTVLEGVVLLAWVVTVRLTGAATESPSQRTAVGDRTASVGRGLR